MQFQSRHKLLKYTYVLGTLLLYLTYSLIRVTNASHLLGDLTSFLLEATCLHQDSSTL